MKGVYVLIIRVDKDIAINVGALGRLSFAKGLYAYVGSAQNNLEARIRRHFKREKRKFWHVDYLLDNPESKVTKVFFKRASKTKECATARQIGERGEAVAGFGCSDCDCKSHLFRLSSYEFLSESMRELNTGKLSR